MKKCVDCGCDIRQGLRCKKCKKRKDNEKQRVKTRSLRLEEKSCLSKTKKGPYDWLEKINAEIRKNGGVYIKK